MCRLSPVPALLLRQRPAIHQGETAGLVEECWRALGLQNRGGCHRRPIGRTFGRHHRRQPSRRQSPRRFDAGRLRSLPGQGRCHLPQGHRGDHARQTGWRHQVVRLRRIRSRRLARPGHGRHPRPACRCGDRRGRPRDQLGRPAAIADGQQEGPGTRHRSRRAGLPVRRDQGRFGEGRRKGQRYPEPQPGVCRERGRRPHSRLPASLHRATVWIDRLLGRRRRCVAQRRNR